jgi:hypothetical protein
MLFDLRGPGRRNAVKVIYVFLTLLMGGGLILFGVGTGSGTGGLLDAFKNNGGSSNGSTFTKRIQNLEKKVRLSPKDDAAWAQLARLQTQEAGVNAQTDPSTGALAYNDAGKADLRRAAASWQRYLSLNPKHPNLDLARIMVFAYAPGALNQPAQAVAAEEVIIDNGKPKAADYRQLAFLAYEAGQTRKGDLSATKAVALTKGKAAKKALQQQFDDFRQALAKQQLQQAQQGAATPGG